MRAKLTNEEVDRRLIGRNIKRLEDIKTGKGKIKWQCLVEGCEYIWETSPSAVLNGNKTGCSRCSGHELLNNEIVDNRLFGKNIKRLEDIKNSHIKIKWQCLVEGCNCIWKAPPARIANGKSGCPRCANLEKYTNESIDKKLEGRNIKRLDDYKNSRIKIKWQCLVEGCNYIWETTPASIISGRGCLRCAGKEKLSNEIVDKRLEGKNIKRLDDYKNIETKIKWQCLVEGCGYIWETSGHIVYGKSGCPRCANLEKLSNEIVDKRLECRNIKRLEDIKNSHIKIKWECLIDGHIWEAAPYNLLNNKSGCPKCKKSKGALKLEKWLNDHNLEFIPEKRFDDCRDKRLLPFDFYVPSKNTLIEFDGKQHYEIVENWGGEEGLQDRIKKDFIKTQYAKNKGIRLIRIAYDCTDEEFEALLSPLKETI